MSFLRQLQRPQMQVALIVTVSFLAFLLFMSVPEPVRYKTNLSVARIDDPKESAVINSFRAHFTIIVNPGQSNFPNEAAIKSVDLKVNIGGQSLNIYERDNIAITQFDTIKFTYDFIINGIATADLFVTIQYKDDSGAYRLAHFTDSVKFTINGEF